MPALKLVLIFDHFGPYHQLRLRAAAERTDVTGVECHSRSRDYAWEPGHASDLPIVTVPSSRDETAAVARTNFATNLDRILSTLNPDVVAIPGWSAFEAITALRWCLRHSIPAVLMSESCRHDEPRQWGKEWIKRRLVSQFSAGLVGGEQHRIYLEELGMSPDRISVGYDVVDNHYFSAGVEDARSKHSIKAMADQAKPSFLASARFIAKKNLSRLLDAYQAYRLQILRASSVMMPWNLTLLGDGPLRNDLESVVQQSGLQEFVSMPGFLQYDQLPSQYAKATAFIHASTTEQWGLVVNEAMAAGLPVLVSDRCGCAPDLVHENINGFTFNPYDTNSITDAMMRITRLSAERLVAFGVASQRLILEWGPQKFGQGIEQASARAVQSPPCTVPLIDKMLLAILARR